MGAFEKALTLYKQALIIRGKVLSKEHPDYTNSLNGLALLYQRMGEYQKALSLYLQALGIREKVPGKDYLAYAISLNNLAGLYKDMGDYRKALPYYQQALSIKEKVLGKEHTSYATSLSNLGLLYQRMGEYEKAFPLYQQAISIKEKIPGKKRNPDYAISLNNLAALYMSIGQYERALPLYLQVLSIKEKVSGKTHPDYATSLSNLAEIYWRVHEYRKALLLYEQASSILEKASGKEHSAYASAINNLALVYRSMKDYQKALPLYQQALSIREKVSGKEHPDYANSLNGLAGLYESMGEYGKALPLYQQTLSILERMPGKRHPDYAACLYNLALLHFSLHKDKEAERLVMMADDIYISHITSTYSALSEQEKMRLKVANLYQFYLLPSFTFNDRSSASTSLQHLYTTELLLKGMVLQDQQDILRAIRKSGDSAILLLYEQWRFNKSAIGKQLLLPIANRGRDLDSLEKATNLLEQQLSRRSAAFRTQQQSLSLTSKDIARKLSKDQAAVEFIRFNVYNKRWTDSTMYAALLLLPGDTVPRFVPLFEERQLTRLLGPRSSKINADTLIQRLYRGLIVRNNSATSLNDSLYQLIWKPLEEYLNKRKIKSVCYAPAGLLHRVAFQALRADSAHLLMDKYTLTQVLSTRSIALPEQRGSRPAGSSVWGNIQYNLQTTTAPAAKAAGRGVDTTAASFNFYTSDTRASRGRQWNALPGTVQEMDSLLRIFRTYKVHITTLNGEQATEERFKALDGKSPQVLHLATHGFFLPVAVSKPKDEKGLNSDDNQFTVQQNPMLRSGLVLAGGNHAWKGGAAIAGREDGILTAYEIAQMDLSGTDLVVLSACETALGDLQGNEGVIGLQRALKMAGVKQIMMSLWQVPDKETAELMALFYRGWLGGKTAREALVEAQMQMKGKYSPYSWAAFVLVE